MSRKLLVIHLLALCLLGSRAGAELYDYTGSLQLSFDGVQGPIEFAVPLVGTAEGSPTAPHNFILNQTQSFTITQTLTGHIPNPLPLVSGSLSNFETVFLGDFVLYPGTVGVAGGGISGLDLDIGSLELLGTTVQADFVTASLGLVSIHATPAPAVGKLVIFNDSGSSSQPITAQAGTWSVATSNLDASGGTLSLVTPISITTAHALSAPVETQARLQLTFVPEPAIGWMLGAGALLLAEAGRRRRRQVRG